MLTWIIFLFIFGIVLIGIEMFVPGGILGLAGGLCLLAAIILTYKAPELEAIGFLGRTAIAAFILLSGVAMLVLWMKYFHLFVPKGVILEREIAGNSTTDLSDLVGQSGKALTALRPVGKIRINDTTYEARTRSGYIDADAEIRIASADGATLVVTSS